MGVDLRRETGTGTIVAIIPVFASLGAATVFFSLPELSAFLPRDCSNLRVFPLSTGVLGGISRAVNTLTLIPPDGEKYYPTEWLFHHVTICPLHQKYPSVLLCFFYHTVFVVFLKRRPI